MPRISSWIWVAFAWVGVILFSSTSLASKWAEATFGFFSGTLFGQMNLDNSSSDLIHLLADKGFHVSLFCILAILLWLALRGSARKPWVIVLCGAIVGSSSEFLQRFFPDRDPALRDVLINVGGTALGVAICIAIARTHSQRKLAPEI